MRQHRSDNDNVQRNIVSKIQSQLRAVTYMACMTAVTDRILIQTAYTHIFEDMEFKYVTTSIKTEEALYLVTKI